MALGNTAIGIKQAQRSLPEGHCFVIIKLNVGSMVAVETSQLREAVRHRDVTVPSHALFIQRSNRLVRPKRENEGQR